MREEHLDFEGGFLKQVNYTESDLLIIDVSETGVTINWSSRIKSASEFISSPLVREMQDYTYVTVGYVPGVRASQSEIRHAKLMSILDIAADAGEIPVGVFDTECKFLRFDLNDFQSVFWEVHVAEQKVFAGVGDSVSFDEALRLASAWMEHTATYSIDVAAAIKYGHEVMQGLPGRSEGMS